MTLQQLLHPHSDSPNREAELAAQQLKTVQLLQKNKAAAAAILLSALAQLETVSVREMKETVWI